MTDGPSQYQFRRAEHGALTHGQLVALLQVAELEGYRSLEVAKAIQPFEPGYRMMMSLMRDWMTVRACLADALGVPRDPEIWIGGADPTGTKPWGNGHRYDVDTRSLPVLGDWPRPVFLGPGQIAILADEATANGWTEIAAVLATAADLEPPEDLFWAQRSGA